MLKFGGNLTGFNTVNYFARNADNVLIGKFCGTAALGFYNKAYQLLLLPIQQITAPISAVAVPTLSRLQAKPEHYRRYYLRAINAIAYLSLPLIACLAALSSEIIALLLGPGWEEAATLFRILAIAAIFQPIVGTAGWVFVSTGNTHRMFRWGLISGTATCAAFLIGIPYGPLGVALAYAIVSHLTQIPCILYAFRGTPLALRELWSYLWRPCIVAFSVLAGTVGAKLTLALLQPSVRFAGGILGGLTFGAASVVVWPPSRREVWLGIRDIAASHSGRTRAKE